MIEIQWKPTRKELRVFSGLLIAFCVVVAAIVLRRTGNNSLSAAIAGSGLFAGAVGLLWPAAIRPLYLAWMIVAFPIGWTVSHLLLAAIFFLIFTPIGWLLRIAAHDSMKRVPDRSKESYWDRRPAPRPPADYFRQY